MASSGLDGGLHF